MKNKYLIRLDDACPTMHHSNWDRMETLLSKYGIKPLVGIIPQNADQKQFINDEDLQFWDRVRQWQNKGWAIALHGFDHCYISENSGMNPLWKRSEFAGVPIDKQKTKILKGLDILRCQGVVPKYFFAPSHTFDENTLVALRECSEIRIISDTIAVNPYKLGDFVFIPQVGGHCFKSPFKGTYTFCFHPSVMDDDDFVKLEKFINTYKSEFCGFDEIKLDKLKEKSIVDKILSWLYFTQRKVRRIR